MVSLCVTHYMCFRRAFIALGQKGHILSHPKLMTWNYSRLTMPEIIQVGQFLKLFKFHNALNSWKCPKLFRFDWCLKVFRFAHGSKYLHMEMPEIFARSNIFCLTNIYIGVRLAQWRLTSIWCLLSTFSINKSCFDNTCTRINTKQSYILLRFYSFGEKLCVKKEFTHMWEKTGYNIFNHWSHFVLVLSFTCKT